MEKKTSIAKHFLVEWREFRQMTQEQLAVAVGTDKSVISLLESGDRGLSDKWARRLAPPLRTTPGAILDHNPNDTDTSIIELWLSVPEEDRPTALRMLKSLRRQTA